jgi:hypothetical protein
MKNLIIVEITVTKSANTQSVKDIFAIPSMVHIAETSISQKNVGNAVYRFSSS